MNIPMLDSLYSGNHIPYSIHTQINQIDPKLDIFWQEYLLIIIKGLPENLRKNIVIQLLKPKNIFWNAAEKKFEYRITDNEDSLLNLISDIPARLNQLKAFAQGTAHHLKNLQEYENVEQIADFLENILGKIHEFQTDGDFEAHAFKQRLHREFIYACASIIRNKENLITPRNYRGLNTHVIKTFINEVYLKHQLLGYWFKTLSNHQLAEMPHELLNTFLRREQKIRQLEIIRTSRYIYAIAPTIDIDSNPFAIRRFLQEETLFSQNRVIFNGVALNPSMLQSEPSEYQARFKQQIRFIITLESKVRTEVFDFLEELEIFHEAKLLPLLFTPFPADMPLNKAVPARLQQYETMLTRNILEPLRNTMRHNIGNKDEYDVLYIGIRQIFGNILSTFKEFLSLPALLLNEQADLLFGRLVAYTLFLEKRRNQLFILQSQHDWTTCHNDIETPLVRLQSIIQQNIDAHRSLMREINQRQATLDIEPGLMDKLLKRREKELSKLDNLKRHSHQAQIQVYQEILKLPHEYPENVVDLEFDSTLIANQSKRHYAFPSGDNGVSRLPFLVALPINGLNFSLSALANELSQKLNKTSF